MSYSIVETMLAYEGAVLRKKSKRTQTLERHYLKHFKAWLAEQSITTTEGLKPYVLEMYQAKLLESQMPSTVNRTFVLIKHYCSKMEEWEMTETDVGLKIRRVSEDQKASPVWQEEELGRVMRNLHPAYADFIHAIWLSGLRPGQIAALERNHVCFHSLTITTETKKGGKVRKFVMPITEEFGALLNRKVQEHGQAFLFLTPRTRNPIEGTAYGKILRQTVRRLGLPRLTAYGLRHSFGTRLSQAGVNLNKIAKLMGHSRTTTTERYLHETHEDLRDALKKLR